MKNKKVVEINKFNNFTNSDKVRVKSAYNYALATSLKNSKGIEVAKFPQNLKNLTEKELKISAAGLESVEGVTYFKQYYNKTGQTVHRLLVYGGDGKIYINQLLDDMFDLYWLYNLTATSPPITLMYKNNDEDVMILVDKSSMTVWRVGYSPYSFTDVPIITSMCMHEGALFCTVKDPWYKVWYATDFDAENVGNISKTSGYISLDGNLGSARKVVVFDEDVYVFSDYGISKINFYRNEKTVSQIYQTNTKIYSNTIDVSGNLILFMTKDGLYQFNGVKVVKSNIDFMNTFNVNNEGAVGASLGEKYYLALKLDFDDDKQILCEAGEYVNNALLIIDTHDSTFEVLRGVDIKSLLPVKTEVFEKMLVVFNSGPTDKIGQISESSKCIDQGLPKFWESEMLVENLNTKLFTKLTVVSDKDVALTLKLDGDELTFTTYQEGINVFNFKARAKNASLEISSNNQTALVQKVEVEYYE